MFDYKSNNRKVRAQRRVYVFEKLGKKCIECNSEEDLQFDHIDPSTKKIGIGDMLLHSIEKIDEELQKCQVLCRSCHNRKTLRDLGWKDSKVEHGTPRSYLHCRCDICKQQHRKVSQEYYKTHKRIIINGKRRVVLIENNLL